MHSGADLGNVVSDARVRLSSPTEEQQAVHRLFDHLQVQSSVRSRAGFGTSWSLQQRRYRAAPYRQSGTRFTMNCAILIEFVVITPVEHRANWTSLQPARPHPTTSGRVRPGVRLVRPTALGRLTRSPFTIFRATSCLAISASVR
jgi:hypothetical protein